MGYQQQRKAGVAGTGHAEAECILCKIHDTNWALQPSSLLCCQNPEVLSRETKWLQSKDPQ